MVYGQDVLEDLRQANDIVEVISQYVTLAQKGANFSGLCPFHREKTPSFSVSSQRQLFHCFGCGEGGNVISFIMKIENLAFLDAVKFLADRVGFKLPEKTGRANITTTDEKTRIYEVYSLAARYYYDILLADGGRACVAYLDHRQLLIAVRRKFGLGYSANGGLREFLTQKGFDDAFLIRAGLCLEGNRGVYDRFRNRLMFPIFDVNSKIIGFGGRIIGEGEPKYMNSPETPVFDKSRTLYGLNLARLTKKRAIILVEGYMDVIALYQSGIKNVVAALGTAFTANHARILKRYCDDVVVLFDSDEAGTKAVLRAIPHLYAAGLGVKVCTLEDAKDPDEYIQNFGIGALADELMAAMDFVDYQIKIARKGRNLDDTPQRIAFLKETAGIIAKLKSPVEREAYARDMSAKYAMDEPSLKEEIKAILGGLSDGDFVDISSSRAALLLDATQGKAHAEAISHILTVMTMDAAFCKQVAHYLTGEEFLDDTLQDIFTKIVAARRDGKEISPADIITSFEGDEQTSHMATKAFMKPPEYDTYKDRAHALAQQVYLLKDTYLRHLVSEATENADLEAMTKAISEQKVLERLKISF